MAATETTRTARVEARIAPDALAVVRRAAELQGRSVSDSWLRQRLRAREGRSRRPRSSG